MSFEEFVQIFNYQGIDFSKHRVLTMFNPPCDSDSFLDYFVENTENLQEIHHLFLNNQVFLIVNKDIILKDTISTYNNVEEPVIEIAQDEGTV